MENLDLQKALNSIFQKGWGLKYLGLFGIYVLSFFVMFIPLILLMLGAALNFIPLIVFGGLLLFIAMLFSIVLNLTIYGYLLLYAHDISYDKNASYRPLSKETLKEALYAGSKSIIAGFAVLPFFLLLFVVLGLVLIICVSLKLEVLGILLAACLFIFGFLLSSVAITKIMSYFIKDMNIASLFHWGKAFEYSKGIKSAVWVVVLPMLASILFCGLFMGMNELFLQILGPLFVVYNFISNIIIQFITFILYAFSCNLLGQYTYAAIKQSEGTEPETLPKEIKNDNIFAVVVISLIVLAFFMLFGVIAALTVPALVNRQADVAAKVKMKKAALQYEQVAEIYMIEASQSNRPVRDLSDFTGWNCEKLGNYFRIYESDGPCSFKTADGNYWSFNPIDGSVVVKNDKDNARYSIKMGLCSNGKINCPEEYPEAAELSHR